MIKMTSQIITRDKIVESIQAMPDDASTDDIIERIIFIKKIEDGLKDVEEGRVFSHDEVKTKYQQWLRK